MNEWAIIILSLFAITVALTVLGLYPQVRSFWFFSAPSYFVLLLTLFALNLLAAYILKNQVFKDGDLIAILVISSLGIFSVIQSFTLKFADYRLIDLSEMIDKFKLTVVNDAGRMTSRMERLKTLKTAKKLSEKYANKVKELEQQLYMLLFQRRSVEEAREIVSQMKKDVEKEQLNLGTLLANRITQMDLERAQLLLKDC
jgi:hypothetical protein